MKGIILSLLGTSVLLANPTLVRETDPLSPADEQKALHVPDGFELQLFAAEPMINKPINLAVDKRGRVWVSSTVEYPYAATKDRWSDTKGSFVKDSRDAIKILEDTDGDGKADKVTDFADGLNIPTGVLPWHKPEHKDGCIAWSIPNIWYFADTTGDGRCDHREVLLGPLGYERDTHGMCSSFRLGPDGWVYATHGFNNQSTAVARDGSTVEMHSGNVFRFRPDGSRVEIWSRGQVNPFGLAFDYRGNLYSADCHSAPVYQLLQGAVYPSFGKPHDGIGFGPTMIEHTHGSTGICGIVYLDRQIWGKAWGNHVLIGNPVNSCINHDSISFAGSTPIAKEQSDFLTSDDPWFRPVDLSLGDDGALYVADFYNRIIGHYEVPLDHPGRDRERGRIWRITPKKKPGEPLPVTPPSLSDNPVADLAASSPFIRRAAAAHLRRDPVLTALPGLLDLLRQTDEKDTHLRHVVRMALREHLKLPGAFQHARAAEFPIDLCLASPSPGSAQFLLEGILRTNDLTNARAILTMVARHGSPDTLDRGIVFARSRLLYPTAATGLYTALSNGLQERGLLEPHPKLVAWGHDLARTILANPTPSEWTALPHPTDPKGKAPWEFRDRQTTEGKRVATLSSLPWKGDKTEQLTGILRSKSFAAPAKLSFWLCGHRGWPQNPANDLCRVRLLETKTGKELRSAFPPRHDICHRTTWNLADIQGQQVQLEIIDGDNGTAYAWLAIAGIEPAVVDVANFGGDKARSEALTSLASTLFGSAPVNLRDQLRAFLPPSPAPPPQPETAEDRKRLDALIKARTAAFTKATTDPRKGPQLFETHCGRCHQISKQGSLLGPQLDGIGARGVARLCEDILAPNRNIDAHFYLTTFTMKDGTSKAGFVRGENGAILQIIDAAGNSHRLNKKNIKSQQTTPVSLMPSGFEKILSEREFNDLLAWLLKQK